MTNDRSDIIICRDCGIVVSHLITKEQVPLKMNDVVFLVRCSICKSDD